MPLKSIFVVLFVLGILNGCGTVNIKDSEWCADLGPVGASCFHVISDKERDIDKDEWDIERTGMYCGRSEAFTNLSTAILKLCRQNADCKWEEVEKKINNFLKMDKENKLLLDEVREEYQLEEPPHRTSPLGCFGIECSY